MISISVLLLVAGWIPAPAQDISLEELLRKAKAAHSQAQDPIRDQVNAALTQLEAPAMRENILRSLAHNLAKLGPAAGPLLVPALDPGDAIPAPHQLRSDRTLIVLKGFQDLGTTLALLRVVEGGSLGHSRAALKALRTSPHHRIVAEALLPTIAAGTKDPLANPALATLSSLAGEESALWLLDCAERQDGPGEQSALQALARADNPHPAALVLANMLRTGRTSAERYWAFDLTLRYFGSVPELLAQGDTYRGPLMGLANGLQAPARASAEESKLASGRALLLKALLRIRDFKLSGDFKRQLWDWQERYPRDRSQILAVLAKGGDAKAKRQFLQTLNSRIKALRKDGGRQLAGALLLRGDAFQRIADFRSAQRDAERGLKVLNEMRNGSGYKEANDLRILAARAAAANGRFRSSADFLEKASLSSKQAAKLARDPIFKEFLESRYGDILKP